MANTSIQRLLTGAAFCLAGVLPGAQASEFNQQASDALDQVKAALVSAKAALDSVDIYRRPRFPAPEGLNKDRTLSCRELEQEMVSLVPQTYSYKPGFFDDSLQGAALWLGSEYKEAYWFVLYGLYFDYQESRRIIPAEDRIEVLRRLKAEKRCFEG